MVYSNKGGFVRVIYLSISLVYWCITLGGRIFNRKNVVLCYHGITNKNSESFQKQMEMIAERIVSRSYGKINPGWFSSPNIVITFDDAFENLLQNVIPLINKLKIPVSIYVVTKYMGVVPGWLHGTKHKDENETLMSELQIKELSLNPLVEIGSHTHNHYRLATLPDNEIKDELMRSKRILENLISTGVDSLAFPHGSYSKKVSEIALESGFKQVLTLDEKLCTNDVVCGRFSMEPTVWSVEFRLTVDGAYAWLFYFRNMIRRLRKPGH